MTIEKHTRTLSKNSEIFFLIIGFHMSHKFPYLNSNILLFWILFLLFWIADVEKLANETQITSF